MAGCGPGSPCDRVLGSAWAYWLGIPVSAPALVAYVALLIFSFLSFGSSSKNNLPKYWRGIFFLGAVIIASAIWFTVLQLSVLKSVCKFCTSAHLLGFTGALLLLSKAPFGELKGNALLLNKRQIVLPVLLGLLSFGSLVAGQTLAPKKLNVVTIHKGDFHFDLREVPLIGTTDSPHYIVSLFDYTCPDCHEMHNQLIAARKRLNNGFSIVSLPLPLDPRCNFMIHAARPKHAQACDYAKIGLAVRRFSLEKFQQYDEWFFGQTGTPPLERAREEASRLVGKEQLEKNLADPWVEKMIQTSVSIYAKNEALTHTTRVPQLIIGDAINTGPVRNVDQLVSLLSSNLSKATF
jgi:hypothetical protein